jgi:hypothetical protein
LGWYESGLWPGKFLRDQDKRQISARRMRKTHGSRRHRVAPGRYIEKERARQLVQNFQISWQSEKSVTPAMHLKTDKTPRLSVRFDKHQPERGRGIGANVCCGSCCCCCCLHSLGGVIGGAVATAKGKSEADGSFIAFYWTALTLMTAGLVAWGDYSGKGLGIFASLLFLPFVQLFTSFLALIWIEARYANVSERKASRNMLGRITVWSFLGAIIGLIAMVVGCKMFQ